MVLYIALMAVHVVFIGATAWFVLVTLREQEPRAPRIGAVLLAALVLSALLTVALPPLRPVAAALFGLITAGGLAMLIPGPGDFKAKAGVDGYVVGPVERFDERDQVFARNRSLIPDTNAYRRYYKMRPDLKETDDRRRAMGGNVGQPGSIDSGYVPNVAMMNAAFGMPPMLGPYAAPRPDPQAKTYSMDPAPAAAVAKGFALHLGADLVGVARTDSRWVYSHRGEIFYDNWDDWGAKLPDPLPYALVFAVEMTHPEVAAAPHTPTVVESAVSYAKGAYISTVLAHWFTGMGYQAEADHSRHYTSLMVPLAIQAGLGEYGRLGYLITGRFGPRVRLFVVTTDMPLAEDRPVDLGVDAFCRVCKKCAESCPSKSLPLGGKETVRGVKKWAMSAESCYRYWALVGTDCSVCMAVCPFARPDTLLHRLVRRMVKRSNIARNVLPYVDNFLYGRRWKPRQAPEWIDYPRTSDPG